MATGRQGSIGIGKETAWGTAVAPTQFYNGTESLAEERARLREAITFGTRAMQPADAGRLSISGAISGMHARPGGLGHLLRAALGAPTTTGGPAPFTHVFKPATTKFSTEAALPPYSITVKRSASPAMIQRFAGAQLNRLTLSQPKDDALGVDTDWVAKSVADVADTTLVHDAGARFRFQHLAVLRDGTPFAFLESVSIGIENNLEVEEVLDGTDVISAVDFGDSAVNVDMVCSFRSVADYADFKANTTRPWKFTWTLDANTSLEVMLPKLNLSSYAPNIGGAGRLTIAMAGQAEHDSVSGYGIQATLKNAVASY